MAPLPTVTFSGSTPLSLHSVLTLLSEYVRTLALSVLALFAPIGIAQVALIALISSAVIILGSLWLIRRVVLASARSLGYRYRSDEEKSDADAEESDRGVDFVPECEISMLEVAAQSGVKLPLYVYVDEVGGDKDFVEGSKEEKGHEATIGLGMTLIPVIIHSDISEDEVDFNDRQEGLWCGSLH